ncbi:TetR family transcriptional regulator [Methyloceanibacter methanicus]|uniref:TetR family transcriptional regulator n=1 Tax=Methyloceanibacter methanicus TaxID=1774968 RepID=A0A1E3W0E4_9HYPH|nr:TetR/AcrR family transcriptional regulator [Methyloceanibacter methanicus]ODR99285.1 TetR family transcriptional regulator [Methyloceanibacter methanicus]
MKRAEKRDHLIDVAATLFNRNGYHAAGIDRLIEEAGIAKTTLYRHFETKDSLILAVLRHIDEGFRDDMRRFVEEHGRTPRDRILATFDYLEEWFESEAFHGCPFISAAAEFGDETSAVFREAAAHKRLVVAYLEELTHTGGFAEPKRLAQEINLLIEGATAVAHVTRSAAPARCARLMAAQILDALPSPAGSCTAD